MGRSEIIELNYGMLKALENSITICYSAILTYTIWQRATFNKHCCVVSLEHNHWTIVVLYLHIHSQSKGGS